MADTERTESKLSKDDREKISYLAVDQTVSKYAGNEGKPPTEKQLIAEARERAKQIASGWRRGNTE